MSFKGALHSGLLKLGIANLAMGRVTHESGRHTNLERRRARTGCDRSRCGIGVDYMFKPHIFSLTVDFIDTVSKGL